MRRTWKMIRGSIAAGASWKVVRLPEPVAPAAREHYLVFAAAIKNEADFLPEWIEFHRHVGVDRFVLYDNGSTDHTVRVLEPYVRSGIVQLIPWQNFSYWMNQQRAAFAHALANFGPRTTWMGFFDVDEFVFPTHRAQLRDVLHPREHLPALCVAGVNFGTAGHLVRPAGSVLRNFRMGVPMERQREVVALMNTKCFVRPERVAAVPSVHWFELRGDAARAYTEHGVPLRHRPYDQPEALSVDVIRYNHYFSKAREDFARKIAGTDARGPMWNGNAASKTRMLDAIEALAVEDHAIDHVLDGFAWLNAVESSALRPRTFDFAAARAA
ncbi:glycosyl transferase family 92 [Panacagrimonas perspica]|uniref:Glycosyl transferase family 92 n=1 Tax=Panacagrimonas perspica TaxID=381431 RepID=A0A4R7P9Y2_9GAMM|nr:glycosyltransferase family 92 protein [Panacagrimonas perspica]TDU30814.1 glycosyl transferase family 92 [Panacagrimonas perspica]THD01625.1 hypothetical protein B1810_19160 [Panacagrimonas perspica]